MDSSVSPKDKIWFLHVCHHISTGLYHSSRRTSSSCLRDDWAGNVCLDLHSKTDRTGSMTFKPADCSGQGRCWSASSCSWNEDWTLLAEWESLTFTLPFAIPRWNLNGMFSRCALIPFEACLFFFFFARILTFDPSAQAFIHFFELELQFMF